MVIFKPLHKVIISLNHSEKGCIEMKPVIEKIVAWGHRNITAKNKSTFEITKEAHLTKKGDCVIAVNASKGALDLDPNFKKMAAKKNSKISIQIEIDNVIQTVFGVGGLSLTFQHPTDLVARKSTFQCGRTLMIKSNKAAFDFSSEFIANIQCPEKKILITLMAEVIE
jgi:hypothetical protein